MKNPYTILEIPQDANNAQILKAMPLAMRKRKYSNNDIAQAKAQLSKPTTRLAADFTFPIFASYDGLETVKAKVSPDIIDVNTINIDAYNSL